MKMRSLKLIRTHHKPANQDEADHTAEAEDLHAEVVEAQAEVVATATAEASTVTTITMVIEDTARRSHLSRAPENPSNLLQALTGKTRTRESVLRTEWATSCMT